MGSIYLILGILLVIIVISIIVKLIKKYWNKWENKKIDTLKRNIGTRKGKKNYYELAGMYQKKIPSLEGSQQKQEYAKYCRQLADLYYSGSEASGIPSDPLKAIHWYTQAIEKGGDLMSLLYLGDIYKNGVQNIVKPNPEFAVKCYQKALVYAKPEETILIKEARERIKDTITEPPSTEVVFETLEQVTGERIGERRPPVVDIDEPVVFANSPWTGLFHRQETGTFWTNPVAVEIEDRVIDLTTPPPPPQPQRVRVQPPIDLDRADFRRPFPREVPIPARVIRPQAPAPQPDNGEIRNDPQNAHDTVLLRGARETIRKLQESTPISISTPQMLLELRNRLNSISDRSRRYKSSTVLDKIETNELPMTNMHEMKEVDILNLVYNRINAPINQSRRNDLMESLIEQLCDGFGTASPVCATGRASRVLSSLDAMDMKSDEIVTLKPKWAIKQELLNKAPTIREKMLRARGDDFTATFNKANHTPEEETQVEQFTNQFKETLRSEYKKEYVDPGLLTQEDLDNELKEWIDAI